MVNAISFGWFADFEKSGLSSSASQFEADLKQKYYAWLLRWSLETGVFSRTNEKEMSLQDEEINDTWRQENRLTNFTAGLGFIVNEEYNA